MEKPKRKLAAIVFTDIVGFTELSSKNEPAALELLNKQRKILKPLVEEYGGEWLKEIGDGLLLIFNNNIEAVLCSVALQKAAKSIPELALRIGVHQGEVVFQGNDVIGDDVNIASRIEPFSSPGGIAISGRVNASLERNPEFETTFLGKPSLKGVSQEIKVYCITSHDIPQSAIIPSEVKLKGIKSSFFKKYVFPITGGLLVLVGGIFWFLLPLLSIGTAVEIPDYEKRIAVLYLENRGNEEDSYFSEGLTEEIITRLSRVKKISVVSRFDVAEFKGKIINLDAIHNALEADFLLTGNVMKLNDKIKISVELVDLEKRHVEWSSSFEKGMRDIFSIQDEVAINIVENLDINIGSKDKKLVLVDPTNNTDAYDTILRMKKESYSETTALENIEIINKILKDDPNYADALAMRGALHIYYFQQGMLHLKPYNAENKMYVDQAITDAKKALNYSPSNLMALSTLPTAYIWSAMKSSSTSAKIFSGRQSLVYINELKNAYPEHYMTSLIIGNYHVMKDINPLTMSPKDYDKAIKLLEKTIIIAEKGIRNNLSDPWLLFAYQGALELMIITEYKYSSFSNSIHYSNILIDLLKNEYNMEMLVRIYYWASLPKIMLGDYDGVIKNVAALDRLANQLPPTYDITRSRFNSSLLLGYSYLQLGKVELGLDMLNKIDTATTFFENDWKARTEYYGYLAMSNYESGNEEKGMEFFNKIDNLIKSLYKNDRTQLTNRRDIHNNPLSWGLLAQGFKVKNLLDKNQIDRAKKELNELEREFSNISVIIPTLAVDIPYYLALIYKGLNNNSEYEKYINMAYDEIMKISNDLSDPHKETYMNNIRRNQEIIRIKNNI